MTHQSPINVFISYAPGDRQLMLELTKFLAPFVRNNTICIWSNDDVLGGQVTETAVRNQLQNAEIFLPLLSAEYCACDEIWMAESLPAFKNRDLGKCDIIPIWLRPFFLPEEFSDLAIIPKDEHNTPKAITSWDKIDEAFTAVTRELVRVITHKKAAEAGDKAHPGRSYTLATIWESIPLKKEAPRLKFLQLDRALAFGKAIQPFGNADLYQDKNLFFLITACKTQNPDNIVNRLFYYCEAIFDKYDCSNSDRVDNVPIHEIEIKLTPQLTWEYFWHQLKSRLRDFIGDEDKARELTFNDFASSAPDLLRQARRIPFFFRIPELEWENSLDTIAHLRYLFRQFSNIPASANKFAFFFIIDLNDLHNRICHQECEIVMRYHAVKQFCKEPFDNSHLELVELLDYATEQDVKSWLSGLIDDKLGEKTLDDYYNQLLECLMNELNPTEKDLYKRKKAFNMDRLGIMQRYAYNHLK